MSKKIDIDRIENKALWKLMNDKGLFTALDLAKEIYDMFNWYGSGDKNAPSTSEDYIRYSKNLDNLRKKILNNLYDTSSMDYKSISAYCKYFKCSADYLLGYIPLPTHENTDIESYTGLSNESIECLHTLHFPYQYGVRDSQQEGRYDIVALNIILEDCYKKLKDNANFATFSNVTASILHDIGIYLDSDSAKMGTNTPMITISGNTNLFTPGEMVRNIAQNRIINHLEEMRQYSLSVRLEMDNNKTRFSEIWQEHAKEIIEKENTDKK